MNFRSLAGVVVALFFATCALAEPTSKPSEDTVGRLTKEVDDARAHLAALEKQLADAKAIPTTGPAKAITSVMDVLNRLPESLRPTAGWDEFSSPKATGWVESNLTGQQFDGIIEIETAKLSRIASFDNRNDSSRWRGYATPTPSTYHFGHATGLAVASGVGNQCVFELDEAGAKKMKEWKKGTKAHVRARIVKIMINPAKRDQNIYLILEEFQIAS